MANLLKHLKTHVTECEVGNMQNEENQENDNKEEMEEKVFTCKICDRTFVSSVRLRKHVKTIHNEVNLQKCENCGKTFSQKGNLNMHVKIVHKNVKEHELELRPSIRSLEIWLGSLEKSPARPRSRSKCSKKNLLDFCSDRKKIENFMLEIARIETQCSK